MPYKKLVFASRSRMTEAFEESNLRMWCLLGVMVTAARPIRAAQVDAPSAHLPSSALSRVGSDSPRVLGSGGRLSLSSINFPPSPRSQSRYPIVDRPTPAPKSESPLCALYDHEQAEGTHQTRHADAGPLNGRAQRCIWTTGSVEKFACVFFGSITARQR